MQEAGVDFLSSRAFGDQVDGEEQTDEAFSYGAAVSLWGHDGSVRHVELSGRQSVSLQGVARVEVRVEREAGLASRLAVGGAAGGSTLAAPDYVTGAAAAVAQACELAGVPCVVAVAQIAPRRTQAMYI
jgi:hypothetical protein